MRLLSFVTLFVLMFRKETDDNTKTQAKVLVTNALGIDVLSERKWVPELTVTGDLIDTESSDVVTLAEMNYADGKPAYRYGIGLDDVLLLKNAECPLGSSYHALDISLKQGSATFVAEGIMLTAGTIIEFARPNGNDFDYIRVITIAD